MFSIGNLIYRGYIYTEVPTLPSPLWQMGEYEVLKRWLFINGRGRRTAISSHLQGLKDTW